MSFSDTTASDKQESPLSTALEQITAIDREIDAAEMKVKELKKKRTALEAVAVEEMSAGRLDGVRVAGRSWRIEWEHSCSAASDRQDDIIAAAQQMGRGDELISVSTTRLKSLLKEMAKEAGRDPKQPWADGTPFAGLVSEYVRPVLRHMTVG